MNRMNLSFLKLTPILITLIAVCLACGGGNDAGGSNSADLATGKTVYKTYCVACHGIDGKLNLNGAKDFTQSTLEIAERKTIITNGKGLMTPFKEVLSEEEINAVAAYTMELTKGNQ